MEELGLSTVPPPWGAAPECPGVFVRLLGLFEVRVGGRLVEVPAPGQRLVALLALRGRRTRSGVAGSLWPDSGERRALGALRTTIWRVNAAAAGLVRSDLHHLELGPTVEIDVECTVAALRASLEFDRPLGELSRYVPERSMLLPEWDEGWLDVEREQLRQLWLHALEAQAERLRAAGSFGRALDLALASVRADPLRESAHRLVIRVHLAEGNVKDAWTAYRNCARILGQELGVTPTAGTTALLPGPGPRQVHDLMAPLGPTPC